MKKFTVTLRRPMGPDLLFGLSESARAEAEKKFDRHVEGSYMSINADGPAVVIYGPKDEGAVAIFPLDQVVAITRSDS